MNGAILLLLLATAPADELATGIWKSPEAKRCQVIALDARKASIKTCGREESQCQETRKERWQAILDCESAVKKGTPGAEAFYILGLAYMDVLVEPKGATCPEHFQFQEGSSTCHYDNFHFDRVIANHRESPFASRAAWQKASHAYVYYECEGSPVCGLENAIHGPATFLKDWPKSPQSSEAVDRLARALERFPDVPIDPADVRHELSGLALKDVRALVPRLAAKDRKRLEAGLTAIDKKIAEISAKAAK